MISNKFYSVKVVKIFDFYYLCNRFLLKKFDFMNKRHKWCSFYHKIAIIIVVIVFVGCKFEENEYQTIQGMVWNTTYRITYKSSKNFLDSVLNEFNAISLSLSVFDNNSLISRINRNEVTEVDNHIQYVYNRSLEINKQTNGMFDPTVSPLIDMWGFGYKEDKFPTPENVDSVLNFIGITKTKIDGGKIFKTDMRQTFNFSAVAKGYGCDCVAAMFKRNGIEDFMIEIGGEVVVSGRSPRGNNWNIAIDCPIKTDSVIHKAHTIISVSDKAVATSGNYRNFKGERVCYGSSSLEIGHIINPISGLPVDTDILSATIVSDKCVDSDAFATACVVLGSEGAKQLSEELNLAMMLIMREDSVWISKEFKKLITK